MSEDLAMCMKDGDTWCALVVQQIADLAAAPTVDYSAIAELICNNTCVPRYVSLLQYFVDYNFDSAFEILCYRSVDGQLCVPQVIDAMDATGVFTTVCLPTDLSLTPECDVAINQFVDMTGCCALTVVNGILDTTEQALFYSLLDAANITVPDNCPVANMTQIKLYINNLAWNVTQASWSDFHDWIEQDFGLNTGLDIQQIAVILEQFVDDNTTLVTVQGLFWSDMSAIQFTSSLANSIEHYAYPLYVTATSLDYTALVDPLFGLMVDANRSFVELVDASLFGGGGALVPSALVALVATAAAIALVAPIF
eukprot:TRINITY_DN89_c0_g1_i7.p1 TRINITY_DN89_c0_g1~~TRINITY_DN89_c0_g1_i7.p1  ORF type:complete len:310 (+),score=101.52 TRINITY_DN89_c0_g1_i7:160-1089(+)